MPEKGLYAIKKGRKKWTKERNKKEDERDG
jgi:hypothetical protein